MAAEMLLPSRIQEGLHHQSGLEGSSLKKGAGGGKILLIITTRFGEN